MLSSLMELQRLCEPFEQLLLFIVSCVFLFVWSLPVFVTSKKEADWFLRPTEDALGRSLARRMQRFQT